ncbi:type II restriction endonuclease [Helicobacter pylori]
MIGNQPQNKLKHGLKKFKKQLVPMNPNNQVNYKLTLNLKELKEIANLTKELKRILKSD